MFATINYNMYKQAECDKSQRHKYSKYSNHHDKHNHNHPHPPTINSTTYILLDDSNDNRSLISESVTAIRVDIHLVGEEPDQHEIRATPGVSRSTTICEVPTKLKSGPCSRDEVLAPS
jgi:hypothetical protein